MNFTVQNWVMLLSNEVGEILQKLVQSCGIIKSTINHLPHKPLIWFLHQTLCTV